MKKTMRKQIQTRAQEVLDFREIYRMAGFLLKLPLKTRGGNWMIGLTKLEASNLFLIEQMKLKTIDLDTLKQKLGKFFWTGLVYTSRLKGSN